MGKFFRTIFILLLLVIIVIVGYFTYQGYDLYQKALNEISVQDKVKQIKSEKPNYTEILELPQDYKNAVIAVEDRRFYTHSGIDLISIGRAVFRNLQEMELVEGGSTITQQLAKNIYFTQEKSFIRKIAEVFMAYEIEKTCTKDEIFELYINTS